MTSTDTYEKAFVDVNVILNALDDNERNKVPKKFQAFIQEYMSTTYDSTIDINVPLEEQVLSRETKALLALLYLKYWYRDEEDKKAFMATLTENEKKYQAELAKKYDINNLFADQKYSSENESDEEITREEFVENNQNVEMVEYKESFIKTIINKILGFFRRNK